MKYIFFLFFSTATLFASHDFHRCALDISNRNPKNPPICNQHFDSDNGYFRIHYGDCTTDIATEETHFLNYVNATNSYLNAVAESAEYSRSLLLAMGFNEIEDDSDEIHDIYLSNRPDGAYGVNHASTQGGSFMIIDNDYANFSCGPCHATPSSLEIMKITVAHEFFHAVQRAYNPGNSNLFFWELSSTWFEDVAYPDINDYLNWAWYSYLEEPENDFSSYIQLKGYSLALFGHYLTQIYDQVENQNSDIMRLIWESFDGFGGDNALQSIHNVLEHNYNSSFSEAWADFNARNNFNSEFNNMNNTIYYYEDQKDIPPITGFGNLNFINSSGTVSDILTKTGEVEIRPYQLVDSDPGFITLTLSDDEDCGTNLGGLSDFSGFLAIKSNYASDWHRIYDVNYIASNNIAISIEPGDKLYFILSSKDTSNVSWNYCLDIPFIYSTDDIFSNGDLNLNNEVNIVDLILLISVILDEVSISEYQFNSADFNNDSQLNIIDVVSLIYIILNP